jgi:ferritin-like metal-binding protein YciE
MAALAHAPMQDEILKNSFANYAFEHFEIASYRALIEMAGAAGDQQAIPLLQESLQEEIAMAEWAGQNLPDVVNTYIRLETQGQKSGI